MKTWRTSELRPVDADPSRGIVDIELRSEIIGSDSERERRAFSARENLTADEIFLPDHLRNRGTRRQWIPVGLGDNRDDEESDLLGSRRDRPTPLD